MVRKQAMRRLPHALTCSGQELGAGWEKKEVAFFEEGNIMA